MRTGPDNPQDTKVWIDYNDDGEFDNSTELVMEAFNAYDPLLNITIPTLGIANNTWLRMRVSSDEVGNTFDACSDMIRGQVEDYAIRVILLGVEEITDIFQVYPNPANEKFCIKSANQNIKNITLYNLIGEKIIEQSNISTKSLSVDVSELPNGTYLVLIESKSGIQITRKIIIH